MQPQFSIRNQKGFTLIELISVLVIMGVMGSVTVKKFDFITDTASERALIVAVKELNIRESLVWSKLKISNEGYTTDEDLFSALDKDLGAKFKWNPGPTIDGGTLNFESQSIALSKFQNPPASQEV